MPERLEPRYLGSYGCCRVLTRLLIQLAETVGGSGFQFLTVAT
jgi:hypothetical protein